MQLFKLNLIRKKTNFIKVLNIIGFAQSPEFHPLLFSGSEGQIGVWVLHVRSDHFSQQWSLQFGSFAAPILVKSVIFLNSLFPLTL